MQTFKREATPNHSLPEGPRETTDLKCPRCQRVLYSNFYETYHAAPWAALRGQRTCQCGYRMSL